MSADEDARAGTRAYLRRILRVQNAVHRLLDDKYEDAAERTRDRGVVFEELRLADYLLALPTELSREVGETARSLFLAGRRFEREYPDVDDREAVARLTALLAAGWVPGPSP